MKFNFRTPLAALALGLALSATSFAQGNLDTVKKALADADAAVQKIVAVPNGQRTWENTVLAIDDFSTKLDNDTSLFVFMQFVSTDATQRDDASTADEQITNWLSATFRREDLYKAVKEYADSKPQLDPVRQRYLDILLRDFRRAGLALSAADRAELQKLDDQMTKLGIDFGTNIREDATRIPLTKEELVGVPENVLKRLPYSNGLYLVGLDNVTYNAVSDNCTNERTRQKVWMGLKRRGGMKNVGILEKLIALRAQYAKKLGYANTVEYEAEPRMAKNAKTIAEFYDKLRPIVRKKAKADMEEFTAAKRKATGDKKAILYPWDYSFYKTQLLRDKYKVDSDKVAEYFPVQNVIKGLVEVTQSLYGINYVDRTDEAGKYYIPVWHKDVKFYEVQDTKTKETLGYFYIDLYPRANKYNHAACWPLQARKQWSDGKLQKPMAAVVANLAQPEGDKPALMQHDAVETFFHEFGHCLHNMLTEQTLGRFSGTSVSRDFVEAPSQMFENWVWEKESLKLFAKHYKTGEVLPDNLLKGMLAARNLGSGIETEHQFFYGLVDYRSHIDPTGKVSTQEIQLKTFPEVELYPAIPEQFYQAAFGHFVGYQAAYYSYQWSLVYAADMFQRFKQLGILNPSAGEYYRKRILARGGSMDDMAMVKDYLGRDPELGAYLKSLGMDK